MLTNAHTATAHSHRRRVLLMAPVVAVAAALISAQGATAATHAVAQPSQTITAPAPVTTGIIMKDGNVCDPIRHMGC